MSLPLIIRPAADREFDDAAHWYEAQRPGLGVEFVEEIQKVLDAIASQPSRYPISEGDVREAAASRFPYCVYYRVKPSRIVVLAVFHLSRDPAEWQGRS